MLAEHICLSHRGNYCKTTFLCVVQDLPDTIQIGGRILPETVWDYVVKLKTSVTKASKMFSIFMPSPCKMVLRVYQLFLLILLFCLGVVCDPVSPCNRGGRGSLRVPVFLLQQQRPFWCRCQHKPFHQRCISCPSWC